MGKSMHVLGKYSSIRPILPVTNIQKSSNLNYEADKNLVQLWRTSEENGHASTDLPFICYSKMETNFWSHVEICILCIFSAKDTAVFSDFC